MPTLLSADQASKVLLVSTRTLYTLSQRGDLPCIKIGRSVRYHPKDIEAYLDRQRTTQGKGVSRG
jgi:excisionase family DNA binding protein